MTPQEWAPWVGIAVSIVFSIAAFMQSRTALADTRAYKDPVFTIEWEPFDFDSSAEHDYVQGQLALILINKGETFAQDVHFVADFDPFGFTVQRGNWGFIAGNGGRVRQGTGIGYTFMGAVGLPIFDTQAGANLATISFTTQTKHQKTVQVQIPNPFDYANHVSRHDEPTGQAS